MVLNSIFTVARKARLWRQTVWNCHLANTELIVTFFLLTFSPKKELKQYLLYLGIVGVKWRDESKEQNLLDTKELNEFINYYLRVYVVER